MSSDAPPTAPATSSDEEITVDGVARPPQGMRPVGDVAPSLDRVAVAPSLDRVAVAPSLDRVAVVPEPPVVAAPAPTDRAELTDALERLRAALVSAGRSLDVVVATARVPEGARPPVA